MTACAEVVPFLSRDRRNGANQQEIALSVDEAQVQA
jgi:hypothetical protein